MPNMAGVLKLTFPGKPLRDVPLVHSRSKHKTEIEGKVSSPIQVHSKLCYFYCGSYYFYFSYRN